MKSLDRILIVFTTLVLILTFQNCSQVAVEDIGAAGLAVDDGVDNGVPGVIDIIPGNPVTTTPGSGGEQPIIDDDETAEYAHVKCLSSLESQIDQAADEDVTLIDRSGNTQIEKARNFSATNVTGNLLVKSAVKAILSGVRGNTHLMAVEVASIEDLRGNLCLGAGSIGTISNSLGNAILVADSIDAIENQTGNLRIHGATVGRLKNVRGNICLYSGAKVLAVEGLVGNLRECE